MASDTHPPGRSISAPTRGAARRRVCAGSFSFIDRRVRILAA
jgi:hypothetical protein